MEAGLAVAKPGNHLRGHRERLLRCAEEIRDRQGQPHGLPDRSFLSAGLGRAHDEPASGRQTELKPGMTFHFMTGLWLEDMGFETTEKHSHHRERCRVLASVPRKLMVKD